MVSKNSSISITVSNNQNATSLSMSTDDPKRRNNRWPERSLPIDVVTHLPEVQSIELKAFNIGIITSPIFLSHFI